MIVDMVPRGASEGLSPREEVRRLCFIRGETTNEAEKKATELFNLPKVTEKMVTELFSQPRANENINRMNNKRGIVVGTSFDFIVDKETGETWDFLKPEDRRRRWSRLEEEQPWVVISSPPCTAFSAIIIGLNYPKMDPDEVRTSATGRWTSTARLRPRGVLLAVEPGLLVPSWASRLGELVGAARSQGRDGPSGCAGDQERCLCVRHEGGGRLRS